MKLFLILSSLTLLAQAINLASTSAFINFVERVNSGTSYEGTTVLLNVDIEFTENYLKRFEPIGKSITKGFLGIFNGQGHVIRDLVINTTSHQHVGLFGNSRGATIKNIVLDSSCTISSWSTQPTNIGGIIGYCQGSSSSCTLENNVNMATQISFNGQLTSKLLVHIGGIAGRIYTDNYATTVRNCANYAQISYAGQNVGTVYMGGVMGECRGASQESVCNFQNCLNYGSIVNTVETKLNARVGGIVGSVYHSIFDNCVNDGTITLSHDKSYTGSLVGYADNSDINNCFYSSNGNTFKSIGHNASSYSDMVRSFDNTDYTLDEEVIAGSFTGKSLVGALNGIAEMNYLKDYSNWSINTAGKTITFTISKDRSSFSFAMNTRIILLPGLASENKLAFSGWYTDEKCTKQLSNFAFTEDTHLYTKWQNNRNKYTVTFETNGGTQLESMQVQYLTKVSLRSDITKNGCPISHWENAYGEEVSWEFTMPNHDVILKAVWKCEWIADVNEFINFADSVNGGQKFEGKTVVLTSDVEFTDDLSNRFTPISDFIGVFDGQGHAIRNIKIVNKTQSYVGIFGHSSGTTIKNVILADSMFASSLVNGKSVYVGGFIGHCKGDVRDCTIENVVSTTTTVEFYSSYDIDEKISLDTALYMGGFAGYIQSTYNKIVITNSANYGFVKFYGQEIATAKIGGLAGYLSGSSTSTTQVSTCINYNAITLDDFNETAKYIEVGGFFGRSQNSEIFYSVSIGNNGIKGSNYINSGAFCGNAQYSSIKNCFYVDDAGVAGSTSGGSSSSNTLLNVTTMEFLAQPAASEIWGEYKRGTTFLTIMNSIADFYHLRGYSHWIKNTDNRNVQFVLNGNTILNLSASFIQLPSLSNADRVTFDGWYIDSSFSKKHDDNNIKNDTTFYARWTENNNEYTIKFREEGGTAVSQIKAQYGSTVALPESTRTDHVFKWWTIDYGDQVSQNFVMPDHDITLYAVWVKTHIHDLQDFTEFRNKVGSGTSFSGETVYLEDDITFTDEASRSFKPIGDVTFPFSGTFDGQGHVIINLEVQSTLKDTGLFGYSEGVTIRNVVVDSSCSFSSTFKSSGVPTRIGGVIANCMAGNKKCIIENSVNIANFEYIETLSSSTSLNIGGITARIESDNYGGFIKNCINYGSISYSGGDVGTLHIGGIVGSITGKDVLGQDVKSFRVLNCLNSGVITHKGFTTKPGCVAGIVGHIIQVEILNCANTGSIVDQARSAPNYFGAISGNTSYSIVDRCYWSADSVGKGITANGTSKGNIITSTRYFQDTLSDLTQTMNDLNAKADEEGWSTWGTNANKYTINFAINCRKFFSTSSPLIMYPDITGIDKSKFYGWYVDTRLTTLLSGTDINIGNSTLYAKWKDNVKYCRINITFEYGGSSSIVSHDYEENILFPQDKDSDTSGRMIWFTDAEMTNEYTNTLADGDDLILYGKKVPSKVVVTTLSLSNPDDFNVESFDEKGVIKTDDLCLDELCEEKYNGLDLDEDKTLFKK